MRIGDTINAGLLNYDPSQFVQQSGISSALLSQALSMASDQIGDVMDKRKEDKENVKSGKERAKAISTLYPELKGPLEPYLFALDDENTPLNQRGRLGKDIGDFITMGIEKQRSDALMGLESQKIGLQRASLQLDRDKLGLDREQTTSKAKLENDKLLSEAHGMMAGIADAVKASGGKAKLPEQSFTLAKEAFESGDGSMALSAAKSAAEAVKPFTGPANLKMEEIPIQLPDGSPGVQQVWSDGSGQLWDLDGQALGDGVLPPPPGVNSITPPMSLPRGVRPAGTPQTAADAKKDQLEIQKLQGELAGQQKSAEAAQIEKDKAAANSKRVLDIIDQYTYVDQKTGERKANGRLDDAVGFGATPGRAFNAVFDGRTAADQQELTLDFIEGSLLEASKALKPVSNDEMKLLMKNRPSLDSKPEVWARFMDRARRILMNGAPEGVGAAGASAVPTAADYNKWFLDQLKK